jgi:transposase
MDMWKPFRLATNAHAPQAAILFDKFQCRSWLLCHAEYPHDINWMGRT